MVRALISGVGVGLAAVAWAAAAPTQEFTAYFKCSTQISDGAITTVYSSGIFLAPHTSSSPRDFANAFKEFLINKGLDAPYANCSTSTTTEKAFKWLDYAEDHALKMKARFKVVSWAPSSGQVIARGKKGTTPQEAPARTAESKSPGSTTSPARDSEQAPVKTRAEHEAEWQAELDEYAAEKAAWEAKIAAQKRAEEHKRAAHEARQEAAARKLAEFERKKAGHARLIEEHMKRQQEFEAARNRHTLCVNGNKQACNEIAAGKPAAREKLADAGEASTDTDATTCVSRPAVSGNATFEGNTAAMVVNGCETAVDVRICLMREGGWNCGVTWGLQPQDRWSHSSFKATGELFWDARVAGSSEPLASPGGS